MESPQESAFQTHPQLIAATFLGFVVAGILVSWLAIGPPTGPLPGVALGSPALLHVLRGALLAALAGLLTILLVNGWAGKWPQQIGFGGASLGYDARESDKELSEAVEGLATDVQGLQADKVDAEALTDSQAAIVTELAELRRHANAVADWAQDEEDRRDQLRDRLAGIGERVAHIEGQLSGSHK